MQRDYTLDRLKAIAIFLACQAHYMHFNDSAIDNFWAILSCAGVPLFFMINGALLFHKHFSIQKHIQKTFRVLGLCIIWKVITVFVLGVLRGVNPFQNGRAQFINYVIGKNGLDGFEVGHFWYLYALFGVYCIYPFLRAAWDTEAQHRAIWFILAVIGIFTFGFNAINFGQSVFCYLTGMNSPFSIYSANSFYIFGSYGYCVFWFLLGAELYNDERWNAHSVNMSGAWWPVSFIVGWFLLFGMNRFQNTVGDANCIVIDGYFCIPTLLMCLGLFQWFITNTELRKKPAVPLIRTIGENTWGIYMLHMIVGVFFLKAQSWFHFPTGILLDLIKTSWMLLGSIAVLHIMKKIPWLRELLIF